MTMLYCEMARAGSDGFDDLPVFVSQLRAAGMDACIGAGSVPPVLGRNGRFDAVAQVRKEPPGPRDTLLLLRGHEIDDRALARLRRLDAPEGLRTIVLGSFPTFQSQIGIRTKLSYVLNDSPEVRDVPAGLGAGRHYLPVFGVRRERGPRRDDRPVVLLVGADLEADGEALLSLTASSALRPVVVTHGKGKQSWIERFGPGPAIYYYSEVVPAALAAMADLAMLFGPPASTYRAQALIADLAVSGVPIVDCSPEGWHLRYGAPALQGPPELASAPGFLASGILDSLPVIAREVARSRFSDELTGTDLLALLQPPRVEPHLPRPVLVAPPESEPRKAEGSTGRPLVFVPTNGVGLGHAQRCSLIAAEIEAQGLAPTFAAFPSCMRMLRSYGFDVMPLVSRSPAHRHEHENDLVNYLRLRRLTAGGRVLVFDGGYVFDSIYRSVLENGLSGVWIRRGLWQEGQANGIALDREKVFRRVIVPSEAFEELNGSYSRGSHVHVVGPIVQTLRLTPDEREGLRSDLAARFGREFRCLAVTMLGAGVAADRSAQLSAICGMMAGRPDTLHLVVVWPTATVEAGAFGWPNTRIVKTHHASALVAASDLFISAVGYNSFHEALYNRVPTIFMAQMSAFMDDQRRRARAAVDRGLADLVEPDELHSLRRRVSDLLDGSRGGDLRERLSSLDLPEPGTGDAARLIMETAECPRPAGMPSLPASAARPPKASTTSSLPMIPERGVTETASSPVAWA